MCKKAALSLCIGLMTILTSWSSYAEDAIYTPCPYEEWLCIQLVWVYWSLPPSTVVSPPAPPTEPGTGIVTQPGPPPGPTPPTGGGGTGNNPPPEPQICKDMREKKLSFNCSQKFGIPPANPSGLFISPRYGTRGLWAPSVLAFANRLYSSDVQGANGNWNQGLTDGIIACNGIVDCQTEVWHFYGQSRIALPQIGPVSSTQINALLEASLGWVGRPNYFQSEAYQKVGSYENGLICKSVAEQAVANQCRP